MVIVSFLLQRAVAIALISTLIGALASALRVVRLPIVTRKSGRRPSLRLEITPWGAYNFHSRTVGMAWTFSSSVTCRSNPARATI